MTLTVYTELEQGSQEWLDARRGILTASVIGKLITPTLKVADNETSRGLTLTLAAERITGHVEYVYPSLDMQRGTDDEPHARDAYAASHVPVEEVGFMVREEAGYRIGYSPDGLVSDDGLIEIKSRKPKEQLKAFRDNKVPTENMAQLMAGLFVTGREWIDYVSYSQGWPLYVKRIERDDDATDAWFDVIEDAVVTFETNVTQIMNNYEAATFGLPLTERRAEEMEIY